MAPGSSGFRGQESTLSVAQGPRTGLCAAVSEAERLLPVNHPLPHMLCLVPTAEGHRIGQLRSRPPACVLWQVSVKGGHVPAGQPAREVCSAPARPLHNLQAPRASQRPSSLRRQKAADLSTQTAACHSREYGCRPATWGWL